MGQKKEKRYAGKILAALFLLVILLCVLTTLFSRRYPLLYVDLINEYSGEYGLEPALVCAVIHAESRFEKDAVSRTGASGLMQIMEPTAYWLAPQIGLDAFSYDQIFEPKVNIRLGCYYLSILKKQYGDIETALSAYNAGSGNVGQWLSDPEYSSDGRTLEHIPFPETRNYVEKVAENVRIYEYVLRFYGFRSRL